MRLKKFQMGGELPEQGGAQAGMEEQIAMMAQEIIQQMGPEGAMVLAQIIVEMVQAMAGQEAPVQEAPVYAKRGGRLIRVARK